MPDTKESAELGIRENISQIANAVNTQDLEKYAKLVVEDFVNMNKDLQGNITTTFSRQERLDVLVVFFEKSPFTIKAAMVPTQVFADRDRAFAHVDGVLRMTPNAGSDLIGFTLFIDLYLTFHKVAGGVWLSERSLGVEKSRMDD